MISKHNAYLRSTAAQLATSCHQHRTTPASWWQVMRCSRSGSTPPPLGMSWWRMYTNATMEMLHHIKNVEGGPWCMWSTGQPHRCRRGSGCVRGAAPVLRTTHPRSRL